jgi:alkanesulfonate monooxygenase SsuD/methylene tetrahydromethanopterin reductase-like flavin-dependent oxidoreductase (luciferase family)
MPRFDIVAGVFALGLPTVEDLRGYVQDAESGDFGGVWVRDHLVFHEPVYDPVALLGAFAGWTSQIELGTAVYLPALRNPVAVGKSFASLSQLSGRHLNFGVGVGGEYPTEWAVAGRDVARRGRYADESIRITAALWRGEAVSHDGQLFAPFENVALDLLPVDPGISVWIGGKSDAALRRAARVGDGWLAFFRSRSALAEQFDRLDGLLDDEARDRDAVERALIVYVVITSNKPADRAIAREFSRRDLNLPGRDDLIDRYAIIGEPEEVAAEIHAFAETGVERFLVLFPVEPWRQREQLARFVEEIVPLTPSVQSSKGIAHP